MNLELLEELLKTDQFKVELIHTVFNTLVEISLQDPENMLYVRIQSEFRENLVWSVATRHEDEIAFYRHQELPIHMRRMLDSKWQKYLDRED